MQNFKNQKGSITLFVLVSAMFFVSSVVGVSINLQNKKNAVDKEYKQVKNNYETEIDNIDYIYNKLSQEIEVSFNEPSINRKDDTINISQMFNINLNKYNIKTLKYGWIYSQESINPNELQNATPSEWVFAELSNTNVATKTDEYRQGYYYLFVNIQDEFGSEKEICSDKPAQIN